MKTKVFKRILSCILCVLVVFTLLPMSVLNASAATSEEVTKKRMNLVNYFNSMATVKWTAGQNFSMKIAGKMQTYYKGRVYYGFPYASGSKSFNLEDFNKELNRTGGYLNNTIGQSDCSTTMGVAYLKYVGGTQMWSVGCFCDSKYGFSKESDYSKLLPGDVLVRYGVSGSSNHVMMVVSVNKSAKTVTVTHQSSGFFKYDPNKGTTGNKTYTNDERNTSWGINQVKTFDGLKNSGYYGYVHKDLKMPLSGKWLTVKYNGNGGSISSDRFKLSSNLVYDGNSVFEDKWEYDKTKQYGLWNASTFGLFKKGYTFVGWGTASSGGKVFDQDDVSVKPSDLSPNIKNGSCTITLYAIWKPITASFNYNANGGSGNTSAFYVTFGNGFTVSNSTVKRSGYKLVGWTVKRNGDNTWFANSAGWQTESAISQKGYKKKVYSNGSNWNFEESWVRKNVGSESYTFYAVWEKVEVKAPELDKKSISLKYKDSDTISVTNGVKVTWQSSNASVVSVDEYGNITAKKKGNATIIATSSDGSKAECNVSVRMEWWQTLLKIISFGIY